jgi:putative FmdB family regulatory protein
VPIYEYECRSCGARFEQLLLNRRTEVLCRECESPNVAQLLSTFAVAGASDRGTAEPGPCGACGAPVRGSCAMENR